eukprot:2707612-Alexandrium_andersonii.AAC.1
MNSPSAPARARRSRVLDRPSTRSRADRPGPCRGRSSHGGSPRTESGTPPSGARRPTGESCGRGGASG